MKKPEVKDFMVYYLEQAPALSKDVGFVPLKANRYAEGIKTLKKVMP